MEPLFIRVSQCRLTRERRLHEDMSGRLPGNFLPLHYGEGQEDLPEKV